MSQQTECAVEDSGDCGKQVQNQPEGDDSEASVPTIERTEAQLYVTSGRVNMNEGRKIHARKPQGGFRWG